MIARTIVDVPASQTDRVFDYAVPEEFEHLIKPGIRVYVPFGPRKIQGFVLELTDTTDVPAGKLREISRLVDLTPPLTNELMMLADWLKDQTLSYHISALQVMLPAAMRASYRKNVVIAEGAELANYSEAILRVFQQDDGISDWDKWQQKATKEERKEVAAGLRRGDFLVIPVVKSNETEKRQTAVYPSINAKLENLTAKQKLVLDYIHNLGDHPEDHAVARILEATGVTRSIIDALVKKGALEKKTEVIQRDPYEGREFHDQKPAALMQEQTEALQPVDEAVRSGRAETFLLRGVTGSGKTEIYLQAIESVLQKGEEAIVLVPEISLTPQMVTRFKGRFGSRVAVLHSALSKGEKYDEWQRIRNKEVDVAVGARSAVFAPFENLGIIIIDEEHEASYKQEDAPRYHAREVAIQRGKHYSCPVVLGSATPSLESFARAKKGVYRLLTMEKRVNDVKMPDVSVIDMREELRSGNRSMFSETMIAAIQTRIEKNEQAVLFLNRRGYSTFIMCRDCGYVAECPHCDISLTYHSSQRKLQCHYCGYSHTIPTLCPECESESIRFFGTGTQKAEEALREVFPDIRVIRMDVDTTSRKGSHEKLLEAFGNKEADVLLGTQMIAKGLDFPDITLVGILAADSMLHLPDFRASERTFQLLTQVSGRAGRHKRPGEVLVQTYTPEHFSIQHVKEHDFLSFFDDEMRVRKAGGYPPYFFLTLVHVSAEDLEYTVQVTDRIARFLREHLSGQTLVYGPVASQIPRIKDRYRYQCMIKYKVEPKLTETLQTMMKTFEGELNRSDLAIVIDTNPNMML
ncbi:primosomal protein N' [Salisediminibacterium halotolerans]|uniref:Replication restart protein PriA n=1 Tax=Salisediminibacterium halotolerans TaxID=517425 RepID=A0A1H9PXS1_9BACI|nr:primosomal protein N' [Salisediminibacterium haloalkalitolerans]SER52940.1 replication restart DNA helicase PriA [Salisediminibacterium haloalkalitolerans]